MKHRNTIPPIMIDLDLSLSIWLWNDAVKNIASSLFFGIAFAKRGLIILATESTNANKQNPAIIIDKTTLSAEPK